MALWRDGGFVADAVVSVPDGEPVPDGPVLVPVKRFLDEREALLARNALTGVVIQPGEDWSRLVVDLPRLALIALAFPKFGDGRAFSTARLLRERHGYTGELRAVGDILFDRIAYMLRCGFDSLDIVNSPTLAELEAGHVPARHQLYQPTGTAPAGPVDPEKPWRRLA